jgi:uncharacterized protein (TIGR03083 family)
MAHGRVGRVTDLPAAYRGVRIRLTEMLAVASSAELARAVPATPEWTVRDNLAHLAGIAADIVSGNLAGVATDEWTAAQVERNRDRTSRELLDAWAIDATTVEPMIDDFGPSGQQLIADAATHEQDIRGALGRPGARDSEAVDVGFAFVGTRLGEAWDAAAAPALVVEHDAGTTTFGFGDGAVTLRVSRFEFLRATMGRRSLAQIAAYDCDGELDPASLVLGLFTARTESLEEPG